MRDNFTVQRLPLAGHIHKIDGLVQERRNSSELAMELHLSSTNPSKWSLFKYLDYEKLRDYYAFHI